MTIGKAMHPHADKYDEGGYACMYAIMHAYDSQLRKLFNVNYI